MPKLILAIAEHCARGEFSEALNIQRRANEVIEVLLSFPSLPATKQILHWQGLIASPACAAPRAALNDFEQIELRRRLSKTAIADSLVR
jgi:dihydrodipicolinate synthase/N-acetylneuraminate lyase